MTKKLNFLLASPVYAQTQDWASINSSCVSNENVATIKGLECLFTNALQAIIPITGLVFFAMLIVGGFKYLTAGGDPKKASAATSTLTKSVIGIVGVIVAWLILKFVSNFTGVDVTEFAIPTPSN